MGKGRFGDVFMAVLRETGMFFAIKVLSKDKIRADKMERQVATEIKLHLHLQHPNILKMYTFFDD